MSNMTRETFTLDVETIEQIDEIKRLIKSPSKSHTVRIAIDQYLKQLQKETA
jgi:metal-responsive CopG/Arc/MetJ family transcriptional regulator